MPQIDYNGSYHVTAISTAKCSKAAIRFPVKASNVKAAKNFAETEALRMLPGWTEGVVELLKNGKKVAMWTLKRSP